MIRVVPSKRCTHSRASEVRNPSFAYHGHRHHSGGLALFRRRPPERVEGSSLPVSENLHKLRRRITCVRSPVSTLLRKLPRREAMQPPKEVAAMPRAPTPTVLITTAARLGPPRAIQKRLRWPPALGSGLARTGEGRAGGGARARGREAGFKEIRGATHPASGPSRRRRSCGFTEAKPAGRRAAGGWGGRRKRRG